MLLQEQWKWRLFAKMDLIRTGVVHAMWNFYRIKKTLCEGTLLSTLFFYHLKKNQIIDYVDGCQDLKARIIRTVGSPEKRFQEDRLRILRALRFSVQLDFDLDPETEQAIFEMKDLLWVIAKERIYAECVKMLQTKKFHSVMEAFKKFRFVKTYITCFRAS